eukprot:262686-Chlamydomonas_euryale.AAC.1
MVWQLSISGAPSWLHLRHGSQRSPSGWTRPACKCGYTLATPATRPSTCHPTKRPTPHVPALAAAWVGDQQQVWGCGPSPPRAHAPHGLLHADCVLQSVNFIPACGASGTKSNIREAPWRWLNARPASTSFTHAPEKFASRNRCGDVDHRAP